MLKTFVTIINYRGYRGNNGGPQMAAYYDCYKNNYLLYDWIAFFDVDEYLVLNSKNSTIQEFLNNSRYYNCQSIKINWKIFTDNNQLDYENKPLNKRFTEVNLSHWTNTACKVLIRGKIQNFSSIKTYNAHDIFNGIQSCNSNGQISRKRYFKSNYKYASLNHYYTKSIKEFCAKIKRGRASLKKTNLNALKYYYFKLFFSINKKTKDKINIFNKELNTSFK